MGIEDEVIRRLERLRVRLRLYALAEGAAVVALLWLGLFFVQLSLDYWFRLGVDMRASLLGVVVLAVCWVGFQRMWRPLRVRAGLGDMAQLVERKHPELNDRLISAVEFRGEEAKPWSSGAMMAMVVGEAREAVRGVRFEGVLNHRRAKQRGMVVGGVLLVMAALAAVSPEVMVLWFQRNVLLLNVDWPQRTHLIIVGQEGGRLRHLRGEDLTVAARADGILPRTVTLEYAYEDGTEGRERMIQSGADRFLTTLRSVNQGLRFRAAGGDGMTAWIEVELVEGPAVESLALRIEPPAYAGLEAYDLREGQRAVEVLKGSTVMAAIETNKPVAEAALMRGRSVVGQCRPAEGRVSWRVSFGAEETAAYHFRLKDAEGFEDRHPVRFSVRVMKDEAPGVRLRLEGVGESVVAEAVLPMELRCEDRYGLADVGLVYEVVTEKAVRGRKAFERFEPRSKQFAEEFEWALEGLSLAAGQRLVVWAEAADFDDVSGPNKGESAKYALRVVTREELESEFSRREQEYRQEFERLLRGQEELRVAALGMVKQAEGRMREEMGRLERQQRNGVRRVKAIADQFGRLLKEWQINRLATPEVEQRVGQGVVEPLLALARGEMAGAAEALGGLARDGAKADAAAIDGQQQKVIERMRAILANMVKWEGYQEVIGLLRDIVRLQDETLKDTENAAGAVLDGLLEGEPTNESKKK